MSASAEAQRDTQDNPGDRNLGDSADVNARDVGNLNDDNQYEQEHGNNEDIGEELGTGRVSDKVV